MSINCLLSSTIGRISLFFIFCTFAVVGQSIAQQETLTKGEIAKLRDIRETIDAGNSKDAVKLLDELIESNPKNAIARYFRGREHFKLNEVEKSVEDFDKYVERQPGQSSSQWERGISLYYAKKYKEGAKQFEDYQTYHDSDVENSVWRFLCVARDRDIKAARENMLEIKGDRRVPMMKIYAMYRGECEPEDVIAEAEKGEPSKGELNHRMFYASLYIGLYEEVRGNHESAEKHLRASVDHKIGHYMWNVADIHVKRVYESKSEKSE